MEQNKKRLVLNTIYMYILSFAKLIIPLISLPYLTKVLSVECVGSVSFVKSIISYMQILIDFGFLLSATKDIVGIIKNKGKVDREVGNTLYAQILFSAVAIIVIVICSYSLEILDGYELYTILSVIPVVLSIFLFEYVFRAYEEMSKISLRYVVMRLIALVLTLIFVKSDSQVILMPIFDIIASLVAVILVIVQLKKLGIKCDFSFKRIKDAFVSIKKSCVYFFTNFMSSAFSLFNTLLIGVILTKQDVAYWTVAFQFLTAIQTMYNPIISSVYPLMLKEKKLKVIHQIMLIFMPIILVGSVAVYFLSDWFVTLVFGDAYIYSGTIIRWIIPVIIASFPAMLYAWPCFSVINKEKVNTIITITCAVIQIIGIVVLIIADMFTLINLAMVRSVVEVILAILRVVAVYRYKKNFACADVSAQQDSEEVVEIEKK